MSETQQLAAIMQMIEAAGVKPTTENLNRASLHLARGDDNAASPVFETAMQRAMAAPSPRQARQAAAAPAPVTYGEAFGGASQTAAPAAAAAPATVAPAAVPVPPAVDPAAPPSGTVVGGVGSPPGDAVSIPPVGAVADAPAGPSVAAQVGTLGAIGGTGYLVDRLLRRGGGAVGGAAGRAVRQAASAPTVPTPNAPPFKVTPSTAGEAAADMRVPPPSPKGNTVIEAAGPPASMAGPRVPVGNTGMVAAPPEPLIPPGSQAFTGNLPRFADPAQIQAQVAAAQQAGAAAGNRMSIFDTQGGKRSLQEAVAARKRAATGGRRATP